MPVKGLGLEVAANPATAGGQIWSTMANGAQVRPPASMTSSDSEGGLKKKKCHNKLVLSLVGQTNHVRVGHQHRTNCDCLYFV